MCYLYTDAGNMETFINMVKVWYPSWYNIKKLTKAVVILILTIMPLFNYVSKSIAKNVRVYRILCIIKNANWSNEHTIKPKKIIYPYSNFSCLYNLYCMLHLKWLTTWGSEKYYCNIHNIDLKWSDILFVRLCWYFFSV